MAQDGEDRGGAVRDVKPDAAPREYVQNNRFSVLFLDYSPCFFAESQERSWCGLPVGVWCVRQNTVFGVQTTGYVSLKRISSAQLAPIKGTRSTKAGQFFRRVFGWFVVRCTRERVVNQHYEYELRCRSWGEMS